MIRTSRPVPTESSLRSRCEIGLRVRLGASFVLALSLAHSRKFDLRIKRPPTGMSEAFFEVEDSLEPLPLLLLLARQKLR